MSTWPPLSVIPGWHFQCLGRLTNLSKSVGSLELATSAWESGDGIIPGSRIRAAVWHIKNKSIMSVYPKLSLQVQFMTFGVEHHGVEIPILKRGKDESAQFPLPLRPAHAPVKTAPQSP